MTAPTGTGPLPPIALADARIASALADSGVRDWVKDALRAAAARDPVDAAADAEGLARLLGDRVDALLAHLAGSPLGSIGISGA